MFGGSENGAKGAAMRTLRFRLRDMRLGWELDDADLTSLANATVVQMQRCREAGFSPARLVHEVFRAGLTSELHPNRKGDWQ